MNILNNLLKIVKPLGSRGLLKFIDDKTYCELVYRSIFNRKVNWDNPSTFSEKIQWLKLNDRKDIYHTFVDKYEVRKYIAEKIGDSYLIPLAVENVLSNADQIEFDKLPNQFVIKCTHGSGCNIICKNKLELNEKEIKNKLNKWMHKNWYWYGREWPYKDLTPRIIIEKYMVDESGCDLKDYKVLCFNGVPKLIETHLNRYNGNHKQIFYDMDWKKTDIVQPGLSNDVDVAKPKTLNEMLELSKKLADGTSFLRVDWYDISGHLYFGELTLYDASGFLPFEGSSDEDLGKIIELKH